MRRASTHPYLARAMDADGLLIPVLPLPDGYLRRQSLPEAFEPNGAVYVIRVERFKATRRIEMDKTFAFLMPNERSIDIDSEIDLKLSELLLRDNDG